MPQFLVVAGPNGAGKSTFSSSFSRPGALIYDPDEQQLKIERQYPDISHEALELAVTDNYKKFELRAVASMQHLTVETNMRNEFLAERADFFREIGYETRLIYMLLPDIGMSMLRVNLRVKQKGHFVDAESIKMNFVKGLENLQRYVARFDQVLIVSAHNETTLKTQPQLLLIIKEAALQYKSENIPEWCEKILTEVEKAAIRHLPRGRGQSY